MKHRIITILFLLTVLNCYCQSLALKIYPDFNNCINCNTYLHLIKEINPSIQKVVVVENGKQVYLKELMTQYEITGYTSQTRALTPKKAAIRGSHCALYSGKQRIDTFPLTDLFKKIPFLNLISAKSAILPTILLKDTLTI
jgi:hypothetical protein